MVAEKPKEPESHKDPFNLGWDETLGKPENVKLTRMDEKRMEMLKILQRATYPVIYQTTFYQNLYSQGRQFSWLAYYCDTLIGEICCRVEPTADGGKRLYIMTLGVLAPYRRDGVASYLLRHAMLDAYNSPAINSIALHVQISNTVAIDFYKKYGFEVKETVKDYYSSLDEKDAHLLMRSAE
eukprot:TRINITY_DN3162_c1_g4_i1.p1 TRINITY_DN3162_c1_g4~~TRINITY_DN3162_c1_g4_i1.p1  ORF type:complete len:198 (+),score=36.17 TRINITY_DN3162_c1_g4_i1:49-594(+)